MEASGQMHYNRLRALIKDLESNPQTKPPSWFREQYLVMKELCGHFTQGFTDIHPEITNRQFRQNCTDIDLYICNMMESYETCGMFCLSTYLFFNQMLLEVVDMGLDETEDSLFAEMFGKMKI
jgi:hypothetical protein|uniref:Uncharacterized protein n=1 Tax=viral metagenome TaxID=1070528 RepID=A0A6C0B1L8_9ZZZZ